MAALTTIAAIAAITASATSVASQLTQKSPKAPSSPAPAPAAPDPNLAADATAKALSHRKAKAVPGGTKSGTASTLLTGASGLTERAPTERKTLLGL